MDENVIQRLGRTDCYPGDPESVEVIQTHLSVVFLAGRNVYKLKKPLKLPFADFSTPERREKFCQEEVRLNRRLCRGIYLGVVPLFDAPGGLSFKDRGGTVVDHAVHMERLPRERMLNELLARDAVTREEIRSVARIMAAFHARAGRGRAVREAGDPGKLRQFALQNFCETRSMRGPVFDRTLHERLEEVTRADFERLLPRLKTRAAAGLVVDGHGDLHARNICLTDPPVVYDCIEFAPSFRCGDVATENAFLVMDLIYRGHPELAGDYLDAYIEASGDEEQRTLIPALVRYRAMVRAKVSAIAAGEPELTDADRAEALASARKHLNLATATAIAEAGPVLVVACGLPGTGKSHVFHELARETSWPLLATDRVRKQLAGIAEAETLPPASYTRESEARTYQETLRRAARRLRSTPVLVDAGFRSEASRRLARESARRAGAKLLVVWVQAGEAQVREWMARRSRDATAVSDADLPVHHLLKKNFIPPRREEGFDLLELPATAGPEKNVARILARLLGR